MTSYFITFPLLFLCFFSLSQARQQRKASNFIEVHVNSLTEEHTCKHSPKAGKTNQGVSLELVHRHGPCSKLSTATTPSHSEILSLDQKRVDSIHGRISGHSLTRKEAVQEDKSVNLIARSGVFIGSESYVVSIGLGTPQQDLYLIFDTGSDLTWTQCEPCTGSCYTQVNPIFDPSLSSSYVNISCGSSECDELSAAINHTTSCSVSTCLYDYVYGDGTTTEGFFAKERLSLTSTDYIDGYLFGCGQDNEGLLNGSAGLIGLGRDPISLVSQAASTYGNYFSYCLPSSDNSTGHLTLGEGGVTATSFSYTPLLSTNSTGFYYIDLQSISVAGENLSISPTVFSTPGTIIDSGTVITNLPPQAYTALRTAFKQHMSEYPTVNISSYLDTCYDFTNYQDLTIPNVTLYFAGGGVLDLQMEGILFYVDASQACLAFTGNKNDSNLIIVGSVNQKGFDIVHDIDGSRIGFGPNGC